MSNLADLERLYLEHVLPRSYTLSRQVRTAIGSHVGGPPLFLLWDSPIHGAGHYACVGCLALALPEHRRGLEIRAGKRSGGPLAPETVEALVLLAFFHDSGRINENQDSNHGRAGFRAAGAAVRATRLRRPRPRGRRPDSRALKARSHRPGGRSERENRNGSVRFSLRARRPGPIFLAVASPQVTPSTDPRSRTAPIS